MSVAYRVTSTNKRARVNPQPYIYEQGTWSPAFTDGTNSAGGTWVGEYVRLGNLVKCFGSGSGITYAGMTTGNLARMTGLPFASKSTDTVSHWVSGTLYGDDMGFGPQASAGGAMAANEYTAAFVSFRITAGSDYANFIETEANTGGKNLTVLTFSGGSTNNMQFTLEYITDE